MIGRERLIRPMNPKIIDQVSIFRYWYWNINHKDNKQPVFYLLLGAMALFMSCKALKKTCRKKHQDRLVLRLNREIRFLDVQLQKVPGITVQRWKGLMLVSVYADQQLPGRQWTFVCCQWRTGLWRIPAMSFSMVNTAQLKSINVLRNPSDTGIYGTQIANVSSKSSIDQIQTNYVSILPVKLQGY